MRKFIFSIMAVACMAFVACEQKSTTNTVVENDSTVVDSVVVADSDSVVVDTLKVDSATVL